MLMEGTPRVHLSPSNEVWISVPLEYVERQISGLVQMPISVGVHDENKELINKKLNFTAYSTVLSFLCREDATNVATGLANTLGVVVDYSELEPPDEEVYET